MAGKRILSPRESGVGTWTLGDWIRPVTTLQGGGDAVPNHAFKCHPLAKVKMTVYASSGIEAQPENRLWCASKGVPIIGNSNRAKLSLMRNLFDAPKTLWYDPRVAADHLVLSDFATRSSLYLIPPQDLLVYEGRNFFGEPRVYARFCYRGRQYDRLTVTDPQVHRLIRQPLCKQRNDGMIGLPNGDDYWLTISLTKPFGRNQHRYKVVAAII